MKITNKMGLPQPIVDAVTNDPYSRGKADISVTQLIGPPRKAALERSYSDQIEEDASDRIWSLMGQSVHVILERANRVGFAERRFYMPVNGWTVSGAFDAYYSNGLLQDYKVTSAWSVKDGAKKEWEQQLNLGRLLIEYEENENLKITKLQIIAILRDWSKMEASRDPSYPQSQVVLLDVPLWSEAEAHRYLKERVTLHQLARIALPECTPEDRWAKPTKYAVMKEGRERAVKLYDKREDAESHASVDKSLRVEERPGQSTRCQFYCSVARYCSQANQTKTPVVASEVTE